MNTCKQIIKVLKLPNYASWASNTTRRRILKCPCQVHFNFITTCRFESLKMFDAVLSTHWWRKNKNDNGTGDIDTKVVSLNFLWSHCGNVFMSQRKVSHSYTVICRE